jgi:hypothetical protein
MQSEISDHRWGVLTPDAARLSVGKNGWYLDEDDAFDWRINSAGFIDASDGALGVAPLVVVSLSRYPGELGMGWGVEFAQGVADAVVARAGHRWWESQLASLSGHANVASVARDRLGGGTPEVISTHTRTPVVRTRERY